MKGTRPFKILKKDTIQFERVINYAISRKCEMSERY